MTPLVAALMSFITFIASIIQTTVSSVTVFPISTTGGPSGDPERYKKGMRMAVHVVTLADANAVLRLGADYIAHSVRDREVDQETIDLLKKNRAFYCPTLTREISTYIYAERPAFLNDPFLLKDGNKAELARANDPAFQETMRNDKSGTWYK